MAKKVLSKKDDEAKRIISNLVDSEIRKSAGGESEQYWANFKKFLKRVDEAKENLRELRDSAYLFENEQIRDIVSEVLSDFAKIENIMDSERDRINRIRNKPLKMKAPEEEEKLDLPSKEEVQQKSKPSMVDEGGEAPKMSLNRPSQVDSE